MRGSVFKTIFWVITGTIEFILIIAVVADLGGENLRDWVRPDAMKTVNAYLEQGRWAVLLAISSTASPSVDTRPASSVFFALSS